MPPDSHFCASSALSALHAPPARRVAAAVVEPGSMKPRYLSASSKTTIRFVASSTASFFASCGIASSWRSSMTGPALTRRARRRVARMNEKRAILAMEGMYNGKKDLESEGEGSLWIGLKDFMSRKGFLNS